MEEFTSISTCSHVSPIVYPSVSAVAISHITRPSTATLLIGPYYRYPSGTCCWHHLYQSLNIVILNNNLKSCVHVIVAVKIQTKNAHVSHYYVFVGDQTQTRGLCRCDPWDTATLRTINAGSIRRCRIDCPAATLLLFISWFNKKLVMLQIAPAQAIIIRINN